MDSKAQEVDEEATEGMGKERDKEIFPQEEQSGAAGTHQVPRALTACLPVFCLLGTLPAGDPSSGQMGTRTLYWGSP